MSEPISVLIVDDDFRVADIHKGFVEEVDGFRVVGTAQS
ncbi:MAG: two-component system response regulator, partial [Actinomycetia bacterium]|nr:two-component system response regulator [Actinomycetes bacterium]